MGDPGRFRCGCRAIPLFEHRNGGRVEPAIARDPRHSTKHFDADEFLDSTRVEPAIARDLRHYTRHFDADEFLDSTGSAAVPTILPELEFTP